MTRSKEIYVKKNEGIKVVSVPYGLGAEAARDFKKGEVVATFTGAVRLFRDFETSEIPYLIAAGSRDLWMSPEAPERFINHSCEPNLRLENFFTLVALRDIAAGEPFSFAYDLVADDDMRWLKVTGLGERFLRWPADFGFTCACGSETCRGVIDRNIVFRGGILTPQTDEDVVEANR
jgi:hypothetical protein